MTTYQGLFSGRAAIVTDCAAGLRNEVARRIVAEGGQICLLDLNADALDAARAKTGAAHACAINVSDHAAVVQATAESVAALGQVDILLCLADITDASVAVQD